MIIVMLSIFLCYGINIYILTTFFINDNGSELPLKTTGNLVFSLFYEVSSNTGYQADITTFNLIFTLLLGIILGLYISKKIGMLYK